ARVVSLSAAVDATLPLGPYGRVRRRGGPGSRARAAPSKTHCVRALGLRRRAAIARVVGVGAERRPSASPLPAVFVVPSASPTASPLRRATSTSRCTAADASGSHTSASQHGIGGSTNGRYTIACEPVRYGAAIASLASAQASPAAISRLWEGASLGRSRRRCG